MQEIDSSDAAKIISTFPEARFPSSIFLSILYPVAPVKAGAYGFPTLDEVLPSYLAPK